MKRIKEKLVLLGQGWFNVTSSWGGDDFSTYEGAVGKVSIAINTAMMLSSIVAVSVIIYGAYLIITSAGDSEKAENGTKAIINGLVGMMIVFLAALAVRFIMSEILD